ncbi:MAG: tRNA pseudouridine(38-40) synthase TruA, partial [Burkholderiales bacterium]
MDKATSFNLAMLLEYDGAGFAGFQKQGFGALTVQGELESALSQFVQQKINIIPAGRTDTGVHALYQVINFTTSVNRELNSWVRGTNAFLPKTLVIREAVKVANEFNARFSALSRTYHYYLAATATRPAILHKKVGWYHRQLDLQAMQEAGLYLVGEKDFSSFRAANCQAATPVRRLTAFNICLKNGLIRFELTANAFLYHMVRNIVGALIYVGSGRLSVEE